MKKKKTKRRERERVFNDEDAGPPELSDEKLKTKDREAMITEMERLSGMQALARKPLEELGWHKRDDGENEREEIEQEPIKWLTTKFVFDWRFRSGSWKRRARLVAREFKGTEHRSDVFSPATSASLTRLVPVIALQEEFSVYSIDVKDAFLQVPQRTRTACEFPKEYVELFQDTDPSCLQEGLLLLRVLPGQRDAALLWSDHFSDSLKEQDFERSVACPTLFRDSRKSILVVHVDDIQAAGKSHHVDPVLKSLGRVYELKIEGPFLTAQELAIGESLQTVRFLKRKYSYHNHELHIHSDPKYLGKLREELKLTGKASKPTPCTQESQAVDNTNPLDQEQAASFRKCVGILLYVCQDRPDLQFAVRGLASKMSLPTFAAKKQLIHVVQYMTKTDGYHCTYRKTPRGMSNLNESIRNGTYDFSQVKPKEHHLLEVYSDSDWAGQKDSRRSTSSGTVFLDSQLIYAFSRTQRSISLSSGEAEYYAAASSASDSLLLKEAIEFLTCRKCVVHLHLDSSAARGIITRQGVGRVKHLQIRTLFLQDLHKQGILRVHPVGTRDNTADIGTKPLSGKRIKLLMHWLGFKDEQNQPVGIEELQEHRQQEQAKATVKRIKSKGNFAFAALLCSLLSGSLEGCSKVEVASGTCLLQSCSTCVGTVQEHVGMCSDTSACALGLQEQLEVGNICSSMPRVKDLCFRNPEKEETVAVEKEVAAMEPSASEKERWFRELTSQLNQLKEAQGTTNVLLREQRREQASLKEQIEDQHLRDVELLRHLKERIEALETKIAEYEKEEEEIKGMIWWKLQEEERGAEMERELRRTGHGRGEEGSKEEEEGSSSTTPRSSSASTTSTQEEKRKEKERKEKIRKVNEELRKREEEEKEKERGFAYPYDDTEYKIYVENGKVYKQHRITGEKVEVGVDYVYKYQKGKEGKGKGPGKGSTKNTATGASSSSDKQASAAVAEAAGVAPQEEGATQEAEKQVEKDEKKWQKERERRERIRKRKAEEKARKEKEEAEEERKRQEATAEEERKKQEAAAEEERKKRQAAAAAEEKDRKRREAAAAAEAERKRREAAAAEAERKKQEAATREGKEDENESLRIEMAQLRELVRGMKEQQASDKRKIISLQEELKKATDSEGSTGEGKKKDKPIGPQDRSQFRVGGSEGAQELYAIFPYEGSDFQWKWVQATKAWLYYDVNQNLWIKDSEDEDGGRICKDQEKQVKG